MHVSLRSQHAHEQALANTRKQNVKADREQSRNSRQAEQSIGNAQSRAKSKSASQDVSDWL